MASQPRIAIVGCGALGSYYGARLARAGHEVHFLLRSDYEVVRRDGVRVIDAEGGFAVRPFAARKAEEIGPAALVIVGLKTTANAEFRRLISPLIGPETAILTLQNGLGNEELLAGLFGAQRVLGGLCFVCLNRTAPGVIQHIAHGRIIMGEFGRPVSGRLRTFGRWFQESGVPCEVTDSLERAHWEKLVWNIPFNGLGVAAAAGMEGVLTGRCPQGGPLGPCLPTDQLLADPRWCGLVRELMAETLNAARGQGLEIPDSVAETQIERTREMGPYRASTLVDFDRGLPLELESLFGEPLRRAQTAGMATPRLAALHQVLTELDDRRLSRAGQSEVGESGAR